MHDKLKSLRDSAEFAEEKLVASAQSLLQEILNEKGLTKSDLAERMGVSRARVSQIFSDNQNFTFRLMASAFHALGEELSLGRAGPKLEFKSMDGSSGCDLSFADVTREISHGFEWLDRQIEIGGQSLQNPGLSKDDVAEVVRDALQAALGRSDESISSKSAKERGHERITSQDWVHSGSNVIPLVRKRAAGNG